MQATFYGRYFMLSCGQAQDDIWRTFHFIWPHRKGVVRPDWLRRDTKYRAAMLRIVANIERYARRKYETSGGIEES